MELERTEDIVLKVLQKYEQTRSDDFVLVYAVYREINFNVATIDRFSEVMLNKILMADKDMMLNDTSYGWNNGECLIGLVDDSSYRKTKTIYIVLEYAGQMFEPKMNLSIYERNDEGTQLIKCVKTFIRNRTRNGEYFVEV